MSLTDATKLIRHNPKDKKHTRAVNSLKKKLRTHKKVLQARLKDVNGALKRLGG
jgi:endonuclease III